MIWDATLNQTSSQANSNKFYRIQLLKDKTQGIYKTWTRWGRVGEVGQSAMLGKGELDEAMRLFQKKFKDKSGLKWENRFDPPLNSRYAFIERSYEEADEKPKQKEESETLNGKNDDADDHETPKSSLPQPVQDLVKFIFNPNTFSRALSDMAYDANKLPLGNLSKRTLTTGYEILKELAELINDPSLTTTKYNSRPYRQVAGNLSDRYYTIIPHAFGRHRPPIIDSMDLVKREVKLLESLSDMEIAHEIIKVSQNKDGENVIDKQYKGLGMKEMTPLSPDSTEYKELETYLKGSQGHTHSVRYQVRAANNDRTNCGSLSCRSSTSSALNEMARKIVSPAAMGISRKAIGVCCGMARGARITVASSARVCGLRRPRRPLRATCSTRVSILLTCPANRPTTAMPTSAQTLVSCYSARLNWGNRFWSKSMPTTTRPRRPRNKAASRPRDWGAPNLRSGRMLALCIPV